MHIAIFRVIVAAALILAASDAAADGKETYTKACALCHASLPPKLGDRAAWEPRMKQGLDAMVAAVIKGKGAMPPRGGNPTLSDDDIRRAVEYMVDQLR